MARFESVEQARQRARRRLPAPVYAALLAGSERGMTCADNTAAFAELGLAPRVADRSVRRQQAVIVMGQQLSLPVMISPTGVQAVHPEGEVAVARAAAARGTALGLSSFASRPIEQVVAANPATFFQTAWTGSRAELAETLDRVRAAGAVGLIATLDWSFSQGRDWGSPRIPERLDLRESLRLAPAVLRRPRWLAGYLRAGALPDLRTPNLAGNPTFFGAYRAWQRTPPPSWADVAWLRAQWPGPFMVKGITRVDDARRALDAGATAISVSNHGGNDLDGIPASIRLLPAIAAAVGDDLEVLLDGGIRYGSDVVKALALGARAVMIGRACLWGLAAGGQAGVENVLDLLRAGIDRTLLGLGRASIHDLTPADLFVPPTFSPHP